MTDAQKKRMFALFGERGITKRDRRLAGISAVVGREVTSSSQLSRDEAGHVIAALEAAIAEQAAS